MSFLDQLSARVNQGFNQVTSQTKDFTEQVKIENEIKDLEKAAQANYEELGRPCTMRPGILSGRLRIMR